MALVPPAAQRRGRPAWLTTSLRHLRFGSISAFVAFLLANGSGCGTDAKGVEDCRDIEIARCEAARSCGTVTDVDECQRYYRDHCLHGLAVDSPARNLVDECVATVKRAGECARTSGSETRLEYCPELVTRNATKATTACDIVRFPEQADECAFLSPVPIEEPVPPEGGAGGQSNGSGGSGGADS